MYRWKNIFAWIILILAVLFPSIAGAWWDQPHQMIGGLTRIVSLPEKDRDNFRECIYQQMMRDGLVAPDRGRDQAFLFWRLGYAISHQKDSVKRAAQAHDHATQKYAAARQQDDLDGCCQAIFQLSEAIHYLQDSIDPTKELNKCRNEITREISKEVASTLYDNKSNWRRLRELRKKSQTEIDKISGGAEGIARELKNKRSDITQQINKLFNKYGDPINKDDDPPKCRREYLDPDLEQGLVNHMIEVFGTMWAAQDRYLELFVKTSSPFDPYTINDKIQVRMKVRPFGSFDSHWENVTKENATSENNVRNSPHVWLRWPDCPVSTTQNRIMFRANISVKGGIPLLENERKDIFVIPHNGFEDLYEKDKPLNAFIVEIPMKEGHVGKFKINGTLLAYPAKEYNQNKQNAKPVATFPFNTSIQYYPAERSATGHVSNTGSMLSVNIGCKNIQRGKRIVRVSVGGKTLYAMGPGVSISFFNTSGVPESAILSFVDYGEEITLTAPLENRTKPITNKFDQNALERFKKLNNNIKNEMQDEEAGLYDIARNYSDLAYFYYAQGVLFDKDKWVESVNNAISYYSRAIAAVKNVSWKGLRRSYSTLGDRNNIDLSRLPKQEREKKRAELLHVDFASVAYSDLFSQTTNAIKFGELPLAGAWLQQLINYYHIMSKDPVYVSSTYRIVDGYRMLAKEIFTQTGDLKAARQNWDTADQWNTIAGPNASAIPFPFVPDNGFDIESSSQ